MNKNLKWYVVIALSILGFILYGTYIINDTGKGLKYDNNNIIEIKTNDKEISKGKSDNSPNNKLPIPPILEDENPLNGVAEFTLTVQYGTKEFINGYEADTLGYNGDYLGPIIKVNKGDEIKINVKNTLEEPTTVHWHGLEVPGEMDGGPHQVIGPNSEWNPYFTVEQPAATLWYHPHLLHRTGEQVYKGLAGFFYIEDEVSKSLDIPKEHGVNDIPLVIQDKRFTKDGETPYQLGMQDLMNGFIGDTVLINGKVRPELSVGTEIIRLRLLNGSNARAYMFQFSNGTNFYQIASDGGFLEEPVELNKLYLSPGERAEILIDFSGYEPGDSLTLQDDGYDLLKINLLEHDMINSTIPSKLAVINRYDINEVKKTREFVMSGMGPMVNINGKQMNMDRIDEFININELELWEISNETTGMGMMGSSPHPFHVHAVQFQIIERDGKEPPLNEKGWKDTVMVQHGEKVKVLARFKHKGLFMYHCHILEHEDLGMMGQFLVE